MAAANPAQPRDPAVVSRRTLARGAVWSVPVIAGVALAPTASAASTDDVVVAAYCVSGVTPANRRGFNVSAAAGVIPIGSTFTFTSDAGLSARPYTACSGCLVTIRRPPAGPGPILTS